MSTPPLQTPRPRPQVIKLISQVIADFADGEISQAASLFDTSIDLQRYLDKSFWKTASLIAASCRSAAVFSECDDSGGLAFEVAPWRPRQVQHTGGQICLFRAVNTAVSLPSLPAAGGVDVPSWLMRCGQGCWHG